MATTTRPAVIDVETLQKTLAGQLQRQDWEKPLTKAATTNLKRLVRQEPERAGKLWDEHAPPNAARPEFLQPKLDAEVGAERAAPDGAERVKAEEDSATEAANARFVQSDKSAKDQQREEADAELALRTLKNGGERADAERIQVENLSEKAGEQDEANRIAMNTGGEVDFDGQKRTERMKNERIQMMDGVHRQFRVVGSRFHFKDQPSKVAFEDIGSKLRTASNDERVAHAMATMADARGWKTIKVSGHPDFKRELWMEASLRGIQVHGYDPKPHELQELRDRQTKMMNNTIEQGPSPMQPQSDDVRIASAAAAAVIASKATSEASKTAMRRIVDQRLEQLAKEGKVPQVHVFDRNAPAPSKNRDKDKERPAIERHSERAR
jgi:hypothetical protein